MSASNGETGRIRSPTPQTTNNPSGEAYQLYLQVYNVPNIYMAALVFIITMDFQEHLVITSILRYDLTTREI